MNEPLTMQPPQDRDQLDRRVQHPFEGHRILGEQRLEGDTSGVFQDQYWKIVVAAELDDTRRPVDGKPFENRAFPDEVGNVSGRHWLFMRHLEQDRSGAAMRTQHRVALVDGEQLGRIESTPADRIDNARPAQCAEGYEIVLCERCCHRSYGVGNLFLAQPRKNCTPWRPCAMAAHVGDAPPIKTGV